MDLLLSGGDLFDVEFIYGLNSVSYVTALSRAV